MSWFSYLIFPAPCIFVDVLLALVPVPLLGHVKLDHVELGAGELPQLLRPVPGLVSQQAASKHGEAEA